MGGRLRVGGGGGGAWETRMGAGPTLLPASSCTLSLPGGGGGRGLEENLPLSGWSPLPLGPGTGGGGSGRELMGVVLVGGGGGLRPPNDCAGDGLGLPSEGGGGTAREGGGGGADRGIV